MHYVSAAAAAAAASAAASVAAAVLLLPVCLCVEDITLRGLLAAHGGPEGSTAVA